MGIGAAFAMGLVKGFRENITEEKKRRLAEQEKIDSMETYAYQAMFDKNKRVPTGVWDLIKSARTEFDKRPNIDIFGRATDSIDLDLASLQSSISNATAYGTVFGTGNNQIGFTSDISKGIDAKLGRSYLSEMAGFANSQGFENKLDKLSDQEFNSLYSSMGAARGALVQASKTGKDPNLYVGIDVMGTQDSDMFRGLYKLDEYYDKRYGGSAPAHTATAGGTVPTNNITTIVNAQAQRHQQKTGMAPDTVGMVRNIQDGTVLYPVLTFNDKAAKDQLGVIADSLGVDTLSLLAYWQTEFMNLPDVDALDQADVLEGSVFLGTTVPNIAQLDPDQDLKRVGQEVIDSVVKKADSALRKSGYAGANRLEALSYMLAPYMAGPKGPTKPHTWGTKRAVKSETIQKYILKRVFGEDKADEVKFKDLTDSQSALESTFTRITELEKEIAGLEAIPAYDAFKGRLSAIFDPEVGVFGGVLKDMGIAVGSEGQLNLENKDQLTYEYSSELNRRVAKAGEAGIAFARLEAMRISLAFEMARAADPSGRLSNQDIEQQLKKLGTNWQTVDQALAAIQVAKKEFKIKSEQYKVLVRLGDSQRVATERDYKIIDGTIAADYLLRNKGAGQTSGTLDRPPPVNIENIIKMPSGKIIDQSTGLPATEEQSRAFNAANGTGT